MATIVIAVLAGLALLSFTVAGVSILEHPATASAKPHASSPSLG